MKIYYAICERQDEIEKNYYFSPQEEEEENNRRIVCGPSPPVLTACPKPE